MEEKGEELCQAAMAGDLTTITSFIDAGYDVSYFDADGLTPLMHAAKHGHTEVVRKLLEAGAPWNALSPSSLSAGDFAMDNGHQDAFDLLLNTGICNSFTRFLIHNFLFMILLCQLSF